MRRAIGLLVMLAAGLCLLAVTGAAPAAEPEKAPTDMAVARSLRPAIEYLIQTYGPHYPKGREFLDHLKQIEAGGENADPVALAALQREALLANRLVSGQPILFVVRKQYPGDHHNTETMFQTGEICTDKFQPGGAIKVIDFARGGKVKTLWESAQGNARDPEVSFDGRRVLFSMRKDKADDYHIYEMENDGAGLRQLTTGPGISDIDPAYLADGRIVFGSTREPKYCHCNRHLQANLFTMDADGSHVVQIGRNTLFEGHPSLLPDGRILYDRWEYIDKHFGPAFGLWTMNPDGTNQCLFYGNGVWSPGGILDARIVPGTHRFIATYAACHDRPWGAIVLADPLAGFSGTGPIVRSWPADIAGPMRGGIDGFGGVKGKYEDPYPLSDRFFLCSHVITGEKMGLFLLDLFGNEVLIHEEDPACFDPMPLAPRARPPVIPSKVDFTRDDGLFYVTDVYRGTGMEKIERGRVKWLRVVEAPAKLFWSNGNWNVDATQAPAMNWNCTSSKRILGQVPVEEDGSAYLSAPAGRFLFFQLLDKDGRMIQSMRSGTTLQPGETAGCTGCHEARDGSAPAVPRTMAMKRGASRLEPWYGPTRDFGYTAEVQPVFDKHCVRCHDYGNKENGGLVLAGDLGLAFNASYVDLRRKSPVRWSADKPDAKKPLVKAVDDGPPEVLPPMAWGSHRSRLVDLLRAGHYDVKLDKEAMDRIVTWIDMNAPYYAYYSTAYGDALFGRSPLDGKQLDRLKKLTGVDLSQQTEMKEGSQVSFTRPELSPCLAKLADKNDPRYVEALAIIQAGKDQLARAPREDMPGFRLVGKDAARQAKYDRLAAAEAEARKTMGRGEK